MALMSNHSISVAISLIMATIILFVTFFLPQDANAVKCFEGSGNQVSQVDCGPNVTFCQTLLIAEDDETNTPVIKPPFYSCMEDAKDDVISGDVMEMHAQFTANATTSNNDSSNNIQFVRDCPCKGDLCNKQGNKCAETPVFKRSCLFAMSDKPQLPQNAVVINCTQNQNCAKMLVMGKYMWTCVYSSIQAPKCGETYEISVGTPGHEKIRTCCGDKCNDKTLDSVVLTAPPKTLNGNDKTVKPSSTPPPKRSNGNSPVWLATPSLLIITSAAVLLS